MHVRAIIAAPQRGILFIISGKAEGERTGLPQMHATTDIGFTCREILHRS